MDKKDNERAKFVYCERNSSRYERDAMEFREKV